MKSIRSIMRLTVFGTVIGGFLKASRKRLISFSLFTAAVVSALAADPHDTKNLQGNWAPIRADLRGQPMADEILKTISLKLDNGTYEVLVGDKPDKGTYKVDSSTSPKAMTVTGTEGPNHGRTFPAIYELKGDTLRICYDLSGTKRPAEFKSTAGTKLYLVTYQRKK